jgi:transposase
VPGIGKVLGLTILYEIHDITRLDRVQEFAFYARLIKCAKESGGEKMGTSGAKMGNVHLRWAFSEAAVLFLRHTAESEKILARLEKRRGKGKALSILAHQIGCAVYYMLSRGIVFSMEKFLAA